jgi:hypothetical protein
LSSLAPSVLLATSFGPGKSYAVPLLAGVLPRLFSFNANHLRGALVTFDGIDPVPVSDSAALTVQRLSAASAPACIHGRLARMRESQRRFFLSRPSYSHLYWHDSDMVPPEDIVARLLEINAPVASGIYNVRAATGVVLPIAAVRVTPAELAELAAINAANGANAEAAATRKPAKAKGKPAKAAPSPEPEDELHPMDAEDGRLIRPYAVGMGCLLVRRDALEKVPFRPPDSYTDDGFGEDVAWCHDSIDALGVNPVVDLTLACWHIDGDGTGTRPTFTVNP